MADQEARAPWDIVGTAAYMSPEQAVVRHRIANRRPGVRLCVTSCLLSPLLDGDTPPTAGAIITPSRTSRRFRLLAFCRAVHLLGGVSKGPNGLRGYGDAK